MIKIIIKIIINYKNRFNYNSSKISQFRELLSNQMIWIILIIKRLKILFKLDLIKKIKIRAKKKMKTQKIQF